MTDDRRRGLIALGIGVLLHAGLAVAVYESPEPEPDPIPPKRMKVQTFNRDVNLNKPKPPPPKPPPPKPPEPLPEIKPIEPIEVTEAKPQPKPEPKPKAAPKKAPRPKPKRRAKRPQKKPVKTIRTIRRSNLGGDSAIKVYEGEVDTFGSPDERPTPENELPDTGPRGDGPADSDGTARTGGTEDPVVVKPSSPPIPPTVVDRVQGEWPAAAPRGGRPVSIMLSLRIDEQGRVVSARVRSKPPAAGTFFDEEAVRVARATRFRPATQDGKPVPFTIRYVVRFTP